MNEELYVDGGCIGANPSKIGGAWAWVLVRGGKHIKHDSGVIRPAQFSVPHITNNVAELVAAIRGLEAMGPGWSGTIHTDSMVTYHRIRRNRSKRLKRAPSIPEELYSRLMGLKASMNYHVTVVKGHPTRKDMDSGTSKNGSRVSQFNVMADDLATKAKNLL